MFIAVNDKQILYKFNREVDCLKIAHGIVTEQDFTIWIEAEKLTEIHINKYNEWIKTLEVDEMNQPILPVICNIIETREASAEELVLLNDYPLNELIYDHADHIKLPELKTITINGKNSNQYIFPNDVIASNDFVTFAEGKTHIKISELSEELLNDFTTEQLEELTENVFLGIKVSENDELIRLKEEKILEVRKIANEEIEAAYPIWKQLNISNLQLGHTEAEKTKMYADIKVIVDKCNALETTINNKQKKSTLETVTWD